MTLTQATKGVVGQRNELKKDLPTKKVIIPIINEVENI